MSKNARRIAPAPSPSPGEEAFPLRTSTGQSAKSSSIKHASTACQNCKPIKRKCDQQTPCSNCAKTNAECIYDEGGDGRRRSARKRVFEEFELKREALDTILGALRNSDGIQLQHLLWLVKKNVSLDEIVQYASAIDEGVDKQHNSSEAGFPPGDTRKNNVLSISALLTDNTPIRVPAAPWTTVTHDDHLVSHLVSAYFTWYHPAYPCLVRELFVRDMIAADLKSQFCSPILVNAMLATACHFLDHRAVFESFGESASRGQHYLKEALTLWEVEAKYPTLSTLQAGQMIATALTLAGRDRLSMSCIDQLNSMADDIRFKAERSGRTKPPAVEMHASLSLAVWSLYMQSVGYSLLFMRPRTYARPTLERLVTDDPVFESEGSWYPYPDNEPKADTRFGQYTNLQYDLHEIGAQISSLLFHNNSREYGQKDRLNYLDKMLQSFSLQLPLPEEEAGLNPHTMELNLVYHWFRTSLFSYAIIPNSPLMSPTPSKDFEHYAQRQCLQSAQKMASLFRRYYHYFSPKHVSIWMPLTAVTAAYALLGHLENPDVQDLYYDICRVITSASGRWFCMRGHARMLLVTAEQHGYVIPHDAKVILWKVAVDNWKGNDHKHFKGSIFPNYELAKGDGSKTMGMGDLLEQWKNLNLHERTSGKKIVASDVDGAIQLKESSSVYTMESL